MPDEFKPLAPAALAAGIAVGDEGALAQKRREAAVRALSVTRAGERAATRAVATGEIPAAFSSQLDPGWTSCQIHGAQGVKAVDARTGEYSEFGTLCEFCYRTEFSAEQRGARSLEVADRIAADRRELEAAVAQLVEDERRARAEFEASGGLGESGQEGHDYGESLAVPPVEQPAGGESSTDLPVDDPSPNSVADATPPGGYLAAPLDPFHSWMERI